ncbi:MAG: hypothetical protein IT529_22105, partial [Burkholderiales bacterium]|nr:hypothetical protein [Burkholderiales bacterium]
TVLGSLRGDLVFRALAADPRGPTVAAGPGFVARFSRPNRISFTPNVPADVAALALDGAGNAVIAGGTFLRKLASDDRTVTFTATLPAAARAVAVHSAGDIVAAGDGFASRYDSSGRLLHTTAFPDRRLNGVALDRGGEAVVVGTAGTDAFVARITASGAVAWSKLVGGAADDAAVAVAIDSRGRAIVAGNSDSADFPVLPGALPSCRRGGPFLLACERDGTLVRATRLQGIGFDRATAIALDAQDRVTVAGSAASRVFFSTPGAAQARFGGGDSDAFAARIDLERPPGTMIACLLNAASLQPGNLAFFPLGTIAPGEIVSLFGTGLGPSDPAHTRLDERGAVANELGGTRVLFDGVPAPLLYVSETQVNAVVPFGLNAAEARVELRHGGAVAGPSLLPVADAVPAVFTLDGSGIGQAVVLNQDGTLNSTANPAARGSVVTFWATGFGRMAPGMADGAVAPLALPLPAPQLTVRVAMRGAAAEVLYAGAMPGAVAGAIQVNARVPSEINFGSSIPLLLTVGEHSSQLQVTLAVD